MPGSQILDSVTFNCLNQIKLVSTALCVYFLFGQRQSRMQLLALALLLTSALLLQADAPPATPSAAAVGATQYRTGVLAILLASMLSVRHLPHALLYAPHSRSNPISFRRAVRRREERNETPPTRCHEQPASDFSAFFAPWQLILPPVLPSRA